MPILLRKKYKIFFSLQQGFESHRTMGENVFLTKSVADHMTT